MLKKMGYGWTMAAILAGCAIMFAGCNIMPPGGGGGGDDNDNGGTETEFDILRAAMQEYLSEDNGTPITTVSNVKSIVDDDAQLSATQIVSVRSAEDYEAGHVPCAINIPWRTLAEPANVDMLADGPIVAYCYTGHTGQVATTILGMMGFDVDNMKFGMMGWTDVAEVLATTPYDCNPPQYDVETTENTLPADNELPEINTGETTATAIAQAQAAAFLPQWSPVITASSVKDIVDDPAQAQNYIILSVRGADDYAAGHVPGAINIPWRNLADEGMLEMLDPNKQIIVYCYTGHTGQIAATLLQMLGYDAINMKFGMMGWNDQQLGDVAPFDCDPPNYDTVAGTEACPDEGDGELDGATLHADNCANCHGASGNDGFAPDITGATAAELTTGLESASHAGITLTEDEVSAIADFLAG